MFSNLRFPTFSEALIGSAVIGGLVTMGYTAYKYFSKKSYEEFPLDGRFGDVLLSAEERKERVAKLARSKSIIDPKKGVQVVDGVLMSR